MMNELFLQDLQSESFSSSKPICLICSNPNNASHHFGSTTCLACAAFMRRTVVLKIKYKCKKDNNCMVHFTMRMICRSCRYQRCIQSGMKENLVQKPRTNKLLINKNCKNVEYENMTLNNKMLYDETSLLTESTDDTNSLTSTSSKSENKDSSLLMMIKNLYNKRCNLLSFYVEELRKAQKRRRFIYGANTTPDIFNDNYDKETFFGVEELTKFNMKEQGKNVRFDHMLAFDYVTEHKNIFIGFSNRDCNVFFKYAFLGYCNMDNVFTTIWSGAYKSGMIAFTNKNSLSIYDKSVGWEDEETVTMELKEKFLRDVNYNFFTNIILPLADMNIDIEEFVALKTLTINSMCLCECGNEGKEIFNHISNEVIKCLGEHYRSKNISISRIGEIILFISNFYTIFRMFAENFTKIELFKLFDIGDEIRDTLNFKNY
uniref:Nuclear receptor domain-containing protein n=1 Tax=Parastrongyloides trichosuri TaxID=131310 RepID=A0A0N4Z714_PARTI